MISNATATARPSLSAIEQSLSDLIGDLRNIQDRVSRVGDVLNGEKPKPADEIAKVPEPSGSLGRLTQSLALAFALANSAKIELSAIEDTVMPSGGVR